MRRAAGRPVERTAGEHGALERTVFDWRSHRGGGGGGARQRRQRCTVRRAPERFDRDGRGARLVRRPSQSEQAAPVALHSGAMAPPHRPRPRPQDGARAEGAAEAHPARASGGSLSRHQDALTARAGAIVSPDRVRGSATRVPAGKCKDLVAAFGDVDRDKHGIAKGRGVQGAFAGAPSTVGASINGSVNLLPSRRRPRRSAL